ncbi:hypothetical protein CCM_04330 [Cordyceps militaris CM01]|uniref:Uncharacterized protein n=1 Tax=Cordyceps militaris (strain CM01) TaxID=983644 RepID=G3JEE5_CORMM|nr:uncharacterized protein CCM_04330 [Cordyceps militaris CM01]EGX92958.1 hypothetical protein CCM_04330 [Cordyceps militaris CM01]
MELARRDTLESQSPTKPTMRNIVLASPTEKLAACSVPAGAPPLPLPTTLFRLPPGWEVGGQTFDVDILPMKTLVAVSRTNGVRAHYSDHPELPAPPSVGRAPPTCDANLRCETLQKKRVVHVAVGQRQSPPLEPRRDPDALHTVLLRAPTHDEATRVDEFP